ncbi:ribosomal L29e protein family domain-containing protein [Neurospora intermedia]|uniref:Large ribosomal subunit protein eL29 n=1 Tax=Neurospora intermedia TaxID=5142 RepID=A0ABR3DKN8_NEUIN
MAKSKNSSQHNQSRKAHRNGIKKPKTSRYPSLKGTDPKFRRNHRHALHGTAKALQTVNPDSICERPIDARNRISLQPAPPRTMPRATQDRPHHFVSALPDRFPASESPFLWGLNGIRFYRAKKNTLPYYSYTLILYTLRTLVHGRTATSHRFATLSSPLAFCGFPAFMELWSQWFAPCLDDLLRCFPGSLNALHACTYQGSALA